MAIQEAMGEGLERSKKNLIRNYRKEDRSNKTYGFFGDKAPKKAPL